MNIKSKLPNVGTTIFTVMSQLANESNAINLSQGFPNFPIDKTLVEILKKKSEEPIHQYTPMTGLPALQQQIIRQTKEQYQRKINTNNVLVTAGATQAIFTTIMALVHPQDEIIVLDPSYDCYGPTIQLTGAKAVHVNLNNNFLPDWEQIANAFNERTKMIIINSPHNPSGRVWSENDFNQLALLMEKYPNVILLSDEVYEFIYFEKKHISIHSKEKLRERSVVISSFGKTFHITGWKLGYLIAPDNIMTEIKKVHQFNVFCVNSVSQVVISEYLGKTNVNELGSFYQKKRDLFRSQLKNSRFKLLPCEGTYFQTVDYSGISRENDVDFCKTLTIKYGVAAIPISVFNKDKRNQKIIRFCFAKDDETLTKATEKLCKI